MNFFQEIGLATNSLNFFGNCNNQNNYFGANREPIVELLQSCTYTEDVKYCIEKSVNQVHNAYKNIKVNVIQFAEGGYQWRYIQIIGHSVIQYEGKVEFHIMFAYNFPKHPPFVRIINPNSNQYKINPSYKSLQSLTDPKSVILNDRLKQIKKWQPSKSVVSIIIEINNMMRNNFPFQNIPKQPQFQEWKEPNPYQKIFGFENICKGASNGGVKKSPIPFKSTSLGSEDIIARAQTMVTKQKKHLQSIKDQHNKLIVLTQLLDSLRYSIESEQNYLLIQNQSMMGFTEANSHVEHPDLSKLIVPKDGVSAQVLELTSSIKARQDCLIFLQAQFNEQKISLSEFLKQLRKIEQPKFQEKVLLQKCLDVSRIR